jgi:hypothetical protein
MQDQEVVLITSKFYTRLVVVFLIYHISRYDLPSHNGLDDLASIPNRGREGKGRNFLFTTASRLVPGPT